VIIFEQNGAIVTLFPTGHKLGKDTVIDFGMNMGIKILFIMIIALEELSFGCRFGLESLGKLTFLCLDGNGFSGLYKDGAISQMIKFLNKRTDGPVSKIEISHG
jgi:hypothetical protein